MGTEIETFTFTPDDGTLPVEVRATIDVDGNPLLVATDVARYFGHSDATHLTRLLDPDEKGLHNVETPGGTQSLSVITEAGLYRLVMLSRSPQAKAFQRWAAHEVFPTIRKHGMYATSSTVEAMLADPDTMITVLTQLKAERVKRQALEAQAAIDAPKIDEWEAFLATDGDMAIAETAKALSSHPCIDLGPEQMVNWMLAHGILFRGHDNRLRPYQPHIKSGYLRTKPQSYENPRTGERVLDGVPQVRVTATGFSWMARRLLDEAALEAVAA